MGYVARRLPNRQLLVLLVHLLLLLDSRGLGSEPDCGSRDPLGGRPSITTPTVSTTAPLMDRNSEAPSRISSHAHDQILPLDKGLP
ncbi:hypothetical protein BS78_10G186900 [Paspalum vaginatum]|nr:hypothetical protein BS78_10G186900 [Paspalum vaginatum]